ncbi:trimeric intracellular cation channel family protein [Flaviaesturariibacter flavus]|uniref:Trimeric intracellular cation channel family protein n=1 Tax=Flaviaesturariibacter flavus TaxID=2502780 RepID=A0A4R1BKD7_9BACT|nr:trimeric intracellular cation channel family protein [Flaviaesturariibacter flavus]TCJ17678.1 trimeric intracellular cation channel family protein [Flaviaesturariibacter flavus]
MHYSQFLHLIDIFGTAAFAIAGAFSAMERRLDPFGVLIIAFVTAIGGGTLRDILVGNLPVSWLNNSTAIIVIMSSALATMFFGTYLKHLQTALFLFDALGIGLFTIIGLEIAVQKEFSAIVCVALGTMSACFGGVLRDVLLNKVPLIFRREIYALACIAGGTAYYFLRRSALDEDVSKILCIGLIFLIRWLAVRYKLVLPRFYKQPELNG